MYCYSLKFTFLQCGNLISIPAGNYMFKVNNRNTRLEQGVKYVQS